LTFLTIMSETGIVSMLIPNTFH